MRGRERVGAPPPPPPLSLLSISHLQALGVAAPARPAVEEVLLAAHPADAAPVAVELALAGVVVEEAAAQAGVRAKGRAAGPAGGGGRLPGVAQCAHQLPHRRPLQLMPF